MKSERSSFDSHWADLATFVKPRRARFSSTDRNRGDRRNQSIIDSTATFAHRTLQSGMHAGMTSPARPWFQLSTPDPDLAKYPPVKAWLFDVTQRLRTIFQQSNLYQTLPTAYGDIGLFGTAAMGVFEDDRDLFRTTPFPVGSYVLGMNDRNVVSTFGREFEMTVLQVVQQFGGKRGQPATPGAEIDWSGISGAVKAMWDQGNTNAVVQVRWVVTDNPEYDPESPFARYKRFMSCYWECGLVGVNAQQAPGDNSKILRESGFDEFPVMAPRWEVSGEDSYGTDCPGMTALGDVRQLQLMEKNKARLIAKAIDPPLLAPVALMNQKTSLVAGDITYVDTRDGNQGLAPIHEIRLEGFQHLGQDMGEVRVRIQRAFFEDLFLMLAQSEGASAQPITAEEVRERHEEKLLALGPVLERCDDELYEPLIDRAFAMADRAGLIPPAPAELHGVRLKTEYTSIMAQAQKLVAVVGLDRFVGTVMPLAELFPATANKLNVNKIVDGYADALGIDPSMVRTDDEADALTQQQQEAAQAEQRANALAKTAQAAQAASQTPLDNGDTALTRVLNGGLNTGALV